MVMKKKVVYALAAILIIAAAVIAIIILKSQPGLNSTLVGAPVSPATLQELKSIATNTTIANAVVVGAASNFPARTASTALYINGKPELLYIGAEYCPYCAITRWGLIIALMRFGNLSNLSYMASSPTDVYADSPTFSFYGSSYQSPYLTFVPVEYETRTGAPLQNLSATQTSIMNYFDGPPNGGIPFVDFGNLTVSNGAPASPEAIYKFNWTYVISQLHNPQSIQAKAIIGSADVFTAQICRMTNNTPPNVCLQPYVMQTEKFLSG